MLREVIQQNRLINETYPDSPTDIKTSNIGYSKKQGFSDIRDLINSGFSEFREHNYYRADSLSEDEVGKLYDNRILNLEKWLNSDEAKEMCIRDRPAHSCNHTFFSLLPVPLLIP